MITGLNSDNPASSDDDLTDISDLSDMINSSSSNDKQYHSFFGLPNITYENYGYMSSTTTSISSESSSYESMSNDIGFNDTANTANSATSSDDASISEPHESESNKSDCEYSSEIEAEYNQAFVEFINTTYNNIVTKSIMRQIFDIKRTYIAKYFDKN